MSDNFYSITVVDSSAKGHVGYTEYHTTYNLNEVIYHGHRLKHPMFERLYGWTLGLGALLGGVLAPIVVDARFPSFWFFITIFPGIILGLIFIGVLFTALSDRAEKRYTATVERKTRGMSQRFIIVHETEWDNFVKSLRDQNRL